MAPAISGAGEPAGGADSTAGGDFLQRRFLEQGTNALKALDYHQAISCFQKVLDGDPSSAPAREGLIRAHASLGIEYSNSGETGRARQEFEKALQLGEDGTARFGLGYLEFLELHDGPAREHLERCVSSTSPDPRAFKMLALIEYRRGETAIALQRIAEALKLDPKDEEAQGFQKRWTIEGGLAGRLVEEAGPHFIFRTDRSVPAQTRKEILAALEGIRDSLGKAMGQWPARPVPVLLLGEEEFRQATGAQHWVAALYDGQIKAPIATGETKAGAPRPGLLRLLRHEYTHVVVKELCPACPNWLNEGIAQYFEVEPPTPGSGSDERASQRERTRRDLRSVASKRIPLEKMPARMGDITDPGLARLAYLEGLGFVDYLAERYQAFRLRLLLATFRRGGSLARAFQETYGAALGDLETAWWKSIEESAAPR